MKHTFADEGVKSRGILVDKKQETKERKTTTEKVAKNPLKTYITDDEMDIVRAKAGDVNISKYLRNFLRDNGFFTK